MNEQNVNPDTVDAVNVDTAPAAKTRKTRKTTAAKNEPDYAISLTSGIKLPEYAGKIPAELNRLFPEFSDLTLRLSGLSLNRVKFFFSYAPDANRPNRRVTQQFYITLPVPKKTSEPSSDLYSSQSHKISGKTYFRIFPEIKKLFTRLEKIGAGNFILNISFHHINAPSKRREHIIKHNAPNNWRD
jgi:hypothetical protein